MIRATTFRLLALAGSMAAVLSCDAGAPTGLGEFLGGDGADTIGGGAGGNPALGGDGRLPTIAIDTPTVYGALVNVGDSILVAVRVRDIGTGVKSIEVAGLTVKGNAEVGTQVITPEFRMEMGTTFSNILSLAPMGLLTLGLAGVVWGLWGHEQWLREER